MDVQLGFSFEIATRNSRTTSTRSFAATCSGGSDAETSATANAVAEGFVRTVRAECLDWLLIANSPHLQRILAVFVDHYNLHRPHRSLSLVPPGPRSSTDHDSAQPCRPCPPPRSSRRITS